ncbi:hypothetical protein WJX73_009588 [Symbiochloris irregularis]|uniref:Uncharacterized protein n=1 Tax=Symbiochloris irregularis TaxID=706552 RepID=A0AAW1PMZ8_9CHLO
MSPAGAWQWKRKQTSHCSVVDASGTQTNAGLHLECHSTLFCYSWQRNGVCLRTETAQTKDVETGSAWIKFDRPAPAERKVKWHPVAVLEMA